MSLIDCLLSNVAIAAGLAVVAAIVGRVANRPQITHALWVLVLVKLVTPPLIHLPVVSPPLEPMDVVAEVDRDSSSVSLASADDALAIREPSEIARVSPVPRPVPGAAVPPAPATDTPRPVAADSAFALDWPTGLIGLWLMGSLLWFGLAGIRLCRFKRLLRRAEPASDGMQAEVRRIAGKFGLKRIPRVLVVDASLPPLIFGLGRRTSVVLPRRLLEGLGGDERCGLFAHELAHLRRGDHWVRWLEFVVLGVYWWNPVAWWARGHIQQAEEECCDAWVLWAFPGKACLYAQTLVDTVDFLVGSSRWKPEVATAFNQGHSLKRRIEMIVNERVSHRLSWRTKLVLVLFAAVVAPLSLLGAPSETSGRAEKDGTSEATESEGVTQEVPAKSVVEAQANGVQERNRPPRSVEDSRVIRGRLVTEDDRPVSGAKVSFVAISEPADGDLTAWIEALKTGEDAMTLRLEHLRPTTTKPHFSPATTGADGNFVLQDVGAERVVTLLIEGPTIETQMINVMTRPAEKTELPFDRSSALGRMTVFYGNTFEHRVKRAKPVVGVVRDKDTGEPLEGVTLRGEPPLIGSGILHWVEATSDDEGKYRLTGLPRRAKPAIIALPADDQPYIVSQFKVADTEGSDETTLDFSLKRGLWIEGQVTDARTGAPVEKVAVFYYAFTDNPHAKEAPGYSGAVRGWIDPYFISEDGSFRRVGLPGRGLIVVRETGGYDYRFGLGADKIEGGTATQGIKLFHTYPTYCASSSFNALVEVDPDENQDRYECDVELDPGNVIQGEVLDPEGRPLAGALVCGGHDYGAVWAREPLSTSTFEARGYDPAEPRHLYFLHKERQLAGQLTVRGVHPKDLTVRLQPWATVSGRIVDGKGTPKPGLEIRSLPSLKQDPDTGEPPEGPLPPQGQHSRQGRVTTDDEGRFTIEGLVPGIKYHLGASDRSTRTYAVLLFDAVLEPGETKSLGDVPLEDAEALRKRYGVE